MISFLKHKGIHIWRKWHPDFDGHISLHWHRSINFGDVLSKYIAEKLSYKSVATVNELTPYVHYLSLGSILSLANEKSIVWGAGIANRDDSFLNPPKQIHMVRGKYSWELCVKNGFKSDIVLGDPGYIISRLYTPLVGKKSYKLGVIPHWVDYKLACEMFFGRDDVLVINLLTDDVEFVINQIVSCEKCISSSLHGLVVSHSYKIPCLHVTFSDRLLKSDLKEFNIGGDGIKFLDYFSSIGIIEYSPIEISHSGQADDLFCSIPDDCGDFGQIDRIIECCPFNEGFRNLS